MPKSKTHEKRKLKKRRKHDKQEALIKKRVAAFNALSQQEQLALLTKWKREAKGEEE